jgi:hypothetical protein
MTDNLENEEYISIQLAASQLNITRCLIDYYICKLKIAKKKYKRLCIKISDFEIIKSRIKTFPKSHYATYITNPDYKNCPRCESLERESWHHVSKFYDDKRKPERYRPNCKQCDKEKRKEQYKNNKGGELEKIKEYAKENKEMLRGYNTKYKQRRRNQQQ